MVGQTVSMVVELADKFTSEVVFLLNCLVLSVDLYVVLVVRGNEF
jgi:hypothetical protein